MINKMTKRCLSKNQLNANYPPKKTMPLIIKSPTPQLYCLSSAVA